MNKLKQRARSETRKKIPVKRPRLPFAVKRPVHLLRTGKRLRRKHIHTLRSVELAVLAGALAVQIGVLWNQVSKPGQTVETHVYADAAAVTPVRFAARMADGQVYGAQYSAKVAGDWSKVAALWRQALRHMKEFSPCDQQAYRQALKSPMLFVEYDGALALDALCAALDVNTARKLDDITAGGVVLVRESDGYALYVRSGSDGALYRADTAVNDTDFERAQAGFQANDCKLAADGDTVSVQPDTMEFSRAEQFPQVAFEAFSTHNDGVNAILAAFSMDADTTGRYTDANGTAVFTRENGIVRMTDSGAMTYDGACPSDGKPYVFAAQVSTSVLEAMNCNAAASLLKTYTDEESGRTILVFGMQVNGIPVDNGATGYFARFAFDEDTLVHADLALRVCESTGENAYVMPEAQTVASLPDSACAVLSLRYTDAAEGTDALWGNGSALWEPSDAQDGMDDLWGTGNSDETQQPNSDNTDVGDTTWDETGDSDGLPRFDASEAVSASWHALYYGDAPIRLTHLRTLSPKDVVPVEMDFDALIRMNGGRGK